jgi:thioredoxin 1
MLNIDSGISAVKFGASWCGPCKLLIPMMKKIEAEFPKIRLLSVDVEDNPKAAKEYRIRRLPTVILFRDGQEVNRVVGAASIDSFRKILRDLSKDQAA